MNKIMSYIVGVPCGFALSMWGTFWFCASVWKNIPTKTKLCIELDFLAMLLCAIRFGLWGIIIYSVMAKIAFIAAFWTKGIMLHEIHKGFAI